VDVRTHLVRPLGVALAYAVVGVLALQLSVPPVHAGPIYPSAGIALAAVLVHGARMLPAVWLGSLLANVAARAWAGSLTTEIFLILLVTALGAAAQAAVGAALVRRHDERNPTLDTPGACARLALFGGLIACVVSASVATATFWAGGLITRPEALDTWWTWWSGDAIGVLIGAPVALALIARPSELWRPRRLSVALPLIAVTLLMALAIAQVATWERQRSASAFRQEASDLARSVTSRFDAHLAALHAVHGAFIASEHVTRDEFRRTSAHWLATLPGLQAIGWSRRLDPGQLAQFERDMQADGRAGLRVFDRDAEGRPQPPAPADEYVVITYIEPESRNAAALGVNALSIPAPQAALRRSLRSSEPVATAGFRLTQERGDQVGMVVYLSVRPRNGTPATDAPVRGEGVVFVTMRMGDALAAVAPDSTYLSMCLTDLTPGARVTRLAGEADCERAAATGAAPNHALVHSHTFDFAGRLLMLHLTPTAQYLATHRSWTAWSFSAAGLLAIGVLGAFLLVVSGRTYRIEGEVAARTAQLQREIAEREAKETQLSESEERFRTVFETASVGLTYCDLDGRLLRFNQRFCEILARPREQMQGKLVTDFTHPADVMENTALRRRLIDGELDLVRRESRYLRPDGSLVPVLLQVTVERDRDGRAQRLVGVVEDITERVKLQEAERGRQAAEASNRAKSEFLSRMSHELRTPLNAMLGFAQLLDLDNVQPLTKTQAERVQQIQAAGWHLLDMINDVLDLSRIEAGGLRLRLEPLDLHALVREGLAMQREAMSADGLQSLVELAPDARFVRGDATRARQIFTNLLSNAIKYNRPGGSVHVSTARTGADTVALRVGDTGIGMSPDQLAHLFEPFNRLGQERQSREGTGIGLVIARRLAELMEGRIDVESRIAVGSTFTCTLPAADAPAAAADATPSSAPAPADGVAGHVLYVEDNAANADVMRGLFDARPGVALEICVDGATAIDAARRARPDLILLDLNLPGMNGLEVLNTLKADPALAAIPVIVVSANAMAEQVREAMRAGAGGYVTKPLRVDEVLARVDAALQR
jgi:PAS domain S-box-containing protein